MTVHAAKSLSRLVAFCIIASGAALVGPPVARADDVFFARRIWTGDIDAIDQGALVVRDGKIVVVGNRNAVTIPTDGQIHDLGDATIIPGLVIAETTLAEGLRGDERAVTPEVRAIDGFNPFADRSRILSGGVTTVAIVPGANRLIPGQGAVVKLAGDNVEARTLSAAESLRLLLNRESRNPPTIFDPPVGGDSIGRPLRPASRQLASTLGGAVAGIRAVLRASQDPGALAGDGRAQSASDVLLRPVAEYVSQRRTIRITAVEPAEVRAALMLAREFNLQVLLVDAVGLDPLLEQVDRGSFGVRGVVLNAGIRPGTIVNVPLPSADSPPPPMPWDNARSLLRSGVKVAIRPAATDDLPDMLYVGGIFRRADLSTGEVLRMLTLTPAELLGVADRVGSLAAGKDADFAVLSNDPFNSGSQVLATYVNGRRVAQSTTNPQVTVISASKVYTGTNETIEGGSVVVDGSTVRGLGRDVSAPFDAIHRRYPRGVVVPGFIDLATGLGLGGSLTGTLPLQTKLGEQLFAGDPAIPIARQGGVTTVLLGSLTASPGPLVAFKLGDQPRVIKDPAAVRFTMAGNLTSQVASLRRSLEQAKSYAETWTRYEAQLAEYEPRLKEYEAAKAKYEAAQKEAATKKSAEKPGDKPESKPEEKAKEKSTEPKHSDDKSTVEKSTAEKSTSDKSTADKSTADKSTADKSTEAKPPTAPTAPSKPQVNPALEPYRELFAGRIPAMVEAKQANAIVEAVKLFRDEFHLTTILIGADDVGRSPELVANKQVSVAVGPAMTYFIEQRRVNLPQILASRQIPFGFQSQGTTGVGMLPMAVQFAVSQGLGGDDALRGLTSTAARMLTLEGRIGSLAVGRDADLVVLSGPPFELSTEVLAVMIDGRWVYEREDRR